MSRDDQFEGVAIRPEVRKHYEYFIACTKIYGSNVVRNVLANGKHGGLRLKFLKNKKDRYQMLQLLDLV